MDRALLLESIASALRESYPDRGELLLLELELRLTPGPWTVARQSRPRLEGERPARDRLVVEVTRAVESRHPDEAHAFLLELDRWLRESLIAELDVLLCQVDLRPLVDWAADALEGGLDSPSLRRLAAESGGYEDDIRRHRDAALRELGLLPRHSNRGLWESARRSAASLVMGLVRPGEGICREIEEAAAGAGRTDLAGIWQRLGWAFDMEEVAPRDALDIIEAALAILADPMPW